MNDIFLTVWRHIQTQTCWFRAHRYTVSWEDDTVSFEDIVPVMRCARCNDILKEEKSGVISYKKRMQTKYQDHKYMKGIKKIKWQ